MAFSIPESWLAGADLSFKPSNPRPNPRTFIVNPQLLWKLAAQYKVGMNTVIHKSGRVVQDFIMGPLLCGDIEEVGAFFGMGVYQNNSFLISNLGVFEPREEVNDGGWTVEEVEFSACSIWAFMGNIGPSFNDASVKDGDCAICVAWENGVLEERLVKVLWGMKAMLDAVT